MKTKRYTEKEITALWKRYGRLSEERKREILPRVWGWMEAEFSMRPSRTAAFFQAAETFLIEAEKENTSGFLEKWLKS